jgi:hypothetical protein
MVSLHNTLRETRENQKFLNFYKRAGSAGRYLASLAVIGLFLTEWRVIADKIPYYNQKFKNQE